MDAEPPLESSEAIFSALRPHCVQLVCLVGGHGTVASFLRDMARLLRRATPPLLQPLLDYTLHPLLLLLDAATDCRSRKEGASDGLARRGLKVRDDVIEGALACLEELLTKCRLFSVDQLVSVMRKLAKGAMLSPSEASEEFREGIVLCLRALLLGLEPCYVESCKCRQVSISQSPASRELLRRPHPKSEAERRSGFGECLLAFLRSQDASPAVGHWLTLLFQTAEAEVARGLRGSAKLRKEALLTLRVLITKVDDADALAFFLPGVVGRFSKALQQSKNTLSGAASSSESIEHAVRGLAEFLSIVLSDEINCQALDSCPEGPNRLDPKGNQSSHSVMEALRSLRGCAEVTNNPLPSSISRETDAIHIGAQSSSKNISVNRTGNWIKETVAHVDKFLWTSFPHLCLHSSERVKKGVLDSIRSLLVNCRVTLRSSRLMFLECLCIMIYDDLESVSAAAQDTLASLLVSSNNFFTQDVISEELDRLIANILKVVLGKEEIIAISHAQKLFALMYYIGPELLVSSILSSPLKVVHFLDIMASCVGPSSQYSAPVRSLALSKPSEVGYLHSIRELKTYGADQNITPDSPWKSRFSPVKDNYSQIVSVTGDYKIPSIPPWCVRADSQKLYASLAGIVRLIGLSLLSGKKSYMPLSVIIDTPLDSVRKLISDIRMKQYNRESWRSWYGRSNSGQLLRKASTAVRILNEMIYGVSDESVHFLNKIFRKNCSEIDLQGNKGGSGILYSSSRDERLQWNFTFGDDIKDDLVNCIGNILYEYMAPEIWDLPVDHKSFLSLHNSEEDPPLYLFHDAAILHQLIIDGIGIFNLSLGIGFKASGFMHNSLFLILQNLICSNSLIKNACDAVLQIISTVSGFPTVAHLVAANADYIVDCLCRNLRHLDVDPQVPSVFSAMLSFIGVAQEILPLLEEPMHLVSLELEVLGRHQHPKLTHPFLKALLEVTKASNIEAGQFPSKYESFCVEIKCKDRMKQKKATACGDNAEFKLEHWEDALLNLREMKRYRHIVCSVALSCIKAASPLVVSKMESICLVALDIIEYGSSALAHVERAYKLEKEIKESIDDAIELCSSRQLQGGADFSEERDENQLLPAVNKIWPYLITCLKQKTSVAAVRRCMHVLSSIIQISGGDFFVRRFRNDGASIWQLLSSSPFRRRPLPQKEGQMILLPYRRAPVPQETMAEVSSLKVQEAALNMIAEIASNKSSSTAIGAVLKKVSGLVVGIACSTIAGLRDASTRALSALAGIDADLIWLLLADLYYSLKKADIPKSPLSCLPAMHELLPQPPSSKDYLYLQYAGEGFGFDIDPSAVEAIFQRMEPELSKAPEM